MDLSMNCDKKHKFQGYTCSYEQDDLKYNKLKHGV